MTRRLTGVVTALTVAVCPVLFAACPEHCGHAVTGASDPFHAHLPAGARETPAVAETPAMLHHAAPAATASQDSGDCHHATETAADQDNQTHDAAASGTRLMAARVTAPDARIAPTCSDCFRTAPMLVAARSIDDHSRLQLRVADGVLPQQRGHGVVAAFATRAAPRRGLAPPSPPAAPVVLRI